MSLIIQGLQSLLGSNPYTSSVGNFIFGEGDDQDIYSGGGSPSVDTSSSESAFADLIGSDEAFADLYNALQNDPDSVYNTINPIGYDSDSLFGNLLEIDPSFGDKLYDGTATTTVIPQGVDSDAMQEYLNENTGIFGLGIGPYLKETFLGTDDEQGLLEQILLGKASKKEGGGNTSGGLAGLLSQVVGGGDEGGGLLNSPLLKLLLANYLTKRDDSPSDVIPVGTQGFAAGSGQGQGLGSMPDYRTFNIQPALMPGVGYANAPPPKMQQGGLSEGPGDITLARLEPGEFVMTRKATDNIGAKNLYKLMKDAERMN